MSMIANGAKTIGIHIGKRVLRHAGAAVKIAFLAVSVGFLAKASKEVIASETEDIMMDFKAMRRNAREFTDGIVDED